MKTILSLKIAFLSVALLPLNISLVTCPAESKDKSATISNAVTLKNLRDATHRLRVAALDLINDVEQRSMVVTGEPELIQPIAYDDKKSIGWARQMLELGPALPPRKSWLDADMNHLGSLIAILQSDFNSWGSPDTSVAGMQDSWNAINNVVLDVQSHYKNLQGLTQVSKVDNIAVGKEALAIYDDMSKLEHPWKQALKLSASK